MNETPEASSESSPTGQTEPETTPPTPARKRPGIKKGTKLRTPKMLQEEMDSASKRASFERERKKLIAAPLSEKRTLVLEELLQAAHHAFYIGDSELATCYMEAFMWSDAKWKVSAGRGGKAP